jgi:hypothetical protein
MLLGIAVFAVPIGELQASVLCQGPVNRIRISNGSSVMIDWGFGLTRLCNLDSNYSYGGGTVSPNHCRTIYSMALTARGTGADFGGSFSTGTTCASVLPGGGDPPTELMNWVNLF